jgi:hypothetical protein
MVLGTARPPNEFGVYMTTRASRTAPFAEPIFLAKVFVPSVFNADPMLTTDGLTLYFQAGDEIHVSRRVSVSADFPASIPVAALNTSASEIQPFLSADGREMWFVRYVGQLGHIFRAPVVGDGFGTPQLVPELSSTIAHDWHPTPSADGLTMYFSSMRPGGKGDHDIWVARRTTATGTFAPATHVSELSTPGLDAPGWLSPDGCRLYFHSRRTTASTELYVAEKPK